MLAFWVFTKDLFIFIRDKQTFYILIAMPLLLIAILGLALSSVVKDSESETKLALFNIAVVDEDQSNESTLFVDDILIARLSSMLNIHKTEHHEVETMLKQDDISLAIYIPKGFGQHIEAHHTPSIKLVNKGNASLEESIISIAFLHYQNVDLAIDHIVEYMTQIFISQAQTTGQSPEMSAITGKLATLNDNGNSLREPKKEMNARMGKETVGSFQYYAVGMGVMYMLITVSALVGNMLMEKEDPVYLRQFISNLTIKHYLLGKYLGLIVMTFLQLTVTILGTSILFNVNWGNSIGSIIFTMFILTISTSAMGLVLGAFTKKAATFNTVSMIGTQILAALGGSFVPIYLFPDWMVAVTRILPNALGLQMFLDIMTGATFVDIWQEGIIAILVSLVLFGVAWIKLGRKGGGIHV